MSKKAPGTADGAGLTNGEKSGPGLFQSGGPPGPGRPKGSRSKISRMLDDLATDDERKAVHKAMIDAAKGGDAGAARLLFARWWPEPRGRAVEMNLPAAETGKDELTTAAAAIFRAVCDGELTPDEAKDLAVVLESQRRAIEVGEIIPLLRELEAASKNKRR